MAHYAASGGRREFVSAMHIEADRSDVQVDGPVADEAKRLLDAIPDHGPDRGGSAL